MQRIRMIGKGGLGLVELYKTNNGAFYAVKQMLYSWNENHFERFKREIKIMQKLSHRNIVKVLNCDVHNNSPYYVMPYFKDGSLRDKLRGIQAKGQIYSIKGASGIIYFLADALEHAHKQGIIHRDLKPENILFQGQEPMIADWGIGKFIHRHSKVLTNGGIGTRDYCSPEQWNKAIADNRSDIFSLGIIYRELLTGSVFGKVEDKNVNAIINKMTNQSPDDRFQSMGEVKSAINSLGVVSKNPLNDFWNTALTAGAFIGLAYLLASAFKNNNE